MACFVFEVKKMRAEISVSDHYCIASEMVWSSSYDLFCVSGKKGARRDYRSRSLLHSFWNGLELELWPVLCFVINHKGTTIVVPLSLITKEPIKWWPSNHVDHGRVMILMIMRSWWSGWYHFAVILGSVWEDFGSILGSCWGQKSSWRFHGRSIRLRPRFPHHFLTRTPAVLDGFG